MELKLGEPLEFPTEQEKKNFTPHDKAHPLAGKIIWLRLIIEDKANGLLSSTDEKGLRQYKVEDWVDRILGHSWQEEKANETVIKYAMRVAVGNIPYSDRVLLVHEPKGTPHLIHVSEIGGRLT